MLSTHIGFLAAILVSYASPTYQVELGAAGDSGTRWITGVILTSGPVSRGTSDAGRIETVRDNNPGKVVGHTFQFVVEDIIDRSHVNCVDIAAGRRGGKGGGEWDRGERCK